MSDYGTTAVHVSPVQNPTPTQDEPEGMSAVRQVFDRAANAIVDASKLAKEVAAIRNELDNMKRDMDYLRARNKELDEMLATTRAQRDEAQAAVQRLNSELNQAKAEIEGLTSAKTSAEHVIEGLRHELDQSRKDRDEYANEWHKVDAELAKAKAQLEEIQEFAQRAFGLHKPQPVQPEPTMDHTIPHGDPAPAQAELATPSTPDHGPAQWDPVSQSYR